MVHMAIFAFFNKLSFDIINCIDRTFKYMFCKFIVLYFCYFIRINSSNDV